MRAIRLAGGLEPLIQAGAMKAPEARPAFQLGQLTIAGSNDSIADEAFLYALEGLANVALPQSDCLSNAAILRAEK